MIALTYNTVIVLIGVTLLGASSGLIGCFAVLRRRALTGDALAHAALPGLCLAVLMVGRLHTPAMLLGALVTGLIGVAIISALRRHTRIKEDSSIAIVLSVFFGAGVVLSQMIQDRKNIQAAGLDTYIFGSTVGMQFEDVLWLAGLSIGTLAIVILLFKEFQLVAFDPDFAQSQGLPVYWLDLLLMGLIAVDVVIGLPAVGVLMVAALLIIPSVTARFWTQRLCWMLVLSALFGVVSSVVGVLGSGVVCKMATGPPNIQVALGLLVLF
ncbi:MAG: metal ABC transporter permease, partial [Gemmataceae bacterium]